MNTFRLPEKTHIGQIWLQTPHLARTLRFYGKALDFKIVESGGRHAGLSATGNWPPQIILTEKSSEAFNYGPTIRPHLFAVRFPSMRSLSEAYLRLKSMEIPLHGLVHQKVCISIFLGAPDDYVVELYADMPRSAWRWHNGQLLRSSTPLEDLNSLPATDRQDTDPVLSAETGIGHIDLSVQDFEEARRFFCDFLGLTATGGDRDALILAAGLYHQHLALRKRGREMRPLDRNCGLVGYRLEVPSMETIYELRQRVHLFGYDGKMLSFFPGLLRLHDPCGCELEIQSADCGEIFHEKSFNA